MTEKRVIVTAAPEFMFDELAEDKIRLTLPMSLVAGAEAQHWRARLNVSTPIPDEFVPLLEASRAAWYWDIAGDEIEGAPV